MNKLGIFMNFWEKNWDADYVKYIKKAAKLGFGLASNHAFIDGNKRIGAHTMLIFLLLNGIELKYGQEELSDLFLNIADSKAGYPETLVWIVQHLS